MTAPLLFDTHAHLHDPAFDGDRAAVLDRARAAGLAARPPCPNFPRSAGPAGPFRDIA